MIKFFIWIYEFVKYFAFQFTIPYEWEDFYLEMMMELRVIHGLIYSGMHLMRSIKRKFRIKRFDLDRF